MTDTLTTIKGYLADELFIEVDEIELDTLLFSTGIIDSFSLVSLLTFVEETFSIRVGATDVNLDNFDSLERIVGYIQAQLD